MSSALFSGIAASLLLFTGCSTKVAVVKSTQAVVAPITRTVSANGKVELTEEFQAHAVGGGEIKKIYVKVGDTVRPGQMLLQLDDSDAKLRISNADFALRAAQNSMSNLQSGGSAEELLNEKADMTALQVTLQQAQSRRRSMQELQSRGAASANEVTGAQIQVTEAQNRINALQLREAKRFSSGDLAVQRTQVARSSTELSAAESGLADRDIRTPIAGTVYGVSVVPYANVNPGEDLVNVADLSKIRVRGFFDEPEIGRLAVGQAVRIIWDAKPEKTWHGHISQTPTSVTNYGTRNVGECLITVDDANGDLIPNVNVTVYVTTLHRENALTIPREALRTDGTSDYVFKIVDGKLQRTPVRLDIVSQTSVQIASGLQPGDVIVQVPINDVELRDGSPVKVQP